MLELWMGANEITYVRDGSNNNEGRPRQQKSRVPAFRSIKLRY